jgi:inner membrane protein involved in colicin E2 resistance
MLTASNSTHYSQYHLLVEQLIFNYVLKLALNPPTTYEKKECWKPQG